MSSVTVTVYVTAWPNANAAPPGVAIVSCTCGVVLPIVIGTDAADTRPVRSVTLRVASNCPFSSYVNDGFCSVESTVPSLSKSHA